MVLSIGWASGQIIIALICNFVSSWRTIFLLTVIPLTLLTYCVYKYTKESPRFLTVKHEFEEAKLVIQ
jgi:MFS family permease